MTLFGLAGERKSRFDDGDWVEAEFITTSGIRLLQTGNIGVGKFIEKEEKKYIDEKAFEQLRCKDVYPGDILICRLADPAGRTCIAPQLSDSRMITSVDVTIFRPLPERADATFLVNVLSTPEWFAEVSERCGGSTRTRISRGQLAQIRVQVPPLKEQRAIATALSDADALIESLDRLIVKKRAIKQASMQQLLTGQTRMPGFDEEWAEKRLGELLTVRYGRNQSGVETPHGRYPILATSGEIGRTDTPLYEHPSVLIGRKGTIDEPQYMDKPFWTVDTLFYTEVHSNADPKFLFYMFWRIPWREYNEATGVPSLNGKTVEAIKVVVPDLEEQIAIAQVLSDMDAEIEVVERRRDKARQIKQGMMQELLTGRTRLVNPEAA